MLYFRFRFVNNIPAGMEPKKTEPRKLGLISGKISGHCKAKLQSRRTGTHWPRVGASQKMIPRERLTRQNRGERRGGEEKYACTQPLFVWRTPVHWIHGGALLGGELCLVQFRMFRLPAANQGHMTGQIGTHFPGLLGIPWFIQILKHFILPWKNSFSS